MQIYVSLLPLTQLQRFRDEFVRGLLWTSFAEFVASTRSTAAAAGRN